MAVIIPGKLLWLAHPRTGSMSLRVALTNAGGQRIPPHHVELDAYQVTKWHQGEPVVCVVRNPYDVVTTWWLKYGRLESPHRKQADPRELPKFIRSFENENFCRDGRLMYHAPTADHVFKYEDGIAHQFRRFGLRLDIPQINITPGKVHWGSYFDVAALAAMVKRFGPEIEELGYKVIEP